MEAENEQFPAPLLRAFSPLHKVALGVACGAVLGVLTFLGTVLAIVPEGRPTSDTSIGLLAQYFWGYSLTWRGAFTGLLWGFATGFVLGWSFALLRNFLLWIWLTVIRSRAEMEQYSDFLDHM